MSDLREEIGRRVDSALSVIVDRLLKRGAVVSKLSILRLKEDLTEEILFEVRRSALGDVVSNINNSTGENILEELGNIKSKIIEDILE